MFVWPLLAAVVGWGLTGCSADEDPADAFEMGIFTFSDAPLTDRGVLSARTVSADGSTFNGTIWQEGVAQIQGTYTEGETYPYGFAVSNSTDMQTYGNNNRYSAFSLRPLETDPHYLVGLYDCGTTAEEEASGEPYRPERRPTIRFTEPLSLLTAHMTCSVQAYRYWLGYDMVNNPEGEVKSDFNVAIDGYRNGLPTNRVTVPIAQRGYNNVQQLIVNTWCTVDLSTLGQVDAVTFTVVTDDPTVPLTFCVDNISYVRYK